MNGTMAVAERIRTARERAQLSQAELARRSGVPQSHISLIESGQVRPTEATVQRLLKAARVRPSAILRRHRDAVLRAADHRRGHDVRVFGSVARGEDNESSDIDLLIDFENGTSIFAVAGLARELEDLLGVHVDIVSNGGRDSRALRRARAEAMPL